MGLDYEESVQFVWHQQLQESEPEYADVAREHFVDEDDGEENIEDLE